MSEHDEFVNRHRLFRVMLFGEKPQWGWKIVPEIDKAASSGAAKSLASPVLAMTNESGVT
ncbi:MAG: hypothetical protein WCB02_34385 [Bradyrhizobium sp.]